VVGRLIEQQDVSSLFEHHGQMYPVSLPHQQLWPRTKIRYSSR